MLLWRVKREKYTVEIYKLLYISMGNKGYISFSKNNCFSQVNIKIKGK
jgi:hypothetical protein